MQQDGVATLHPWVGFEQPIGGAEAAHGHPCGGFVRDIDRQLDERSDRHDAFGRVGTQRATGVGDPVADAIAIDVRANCFDDAGRFDAHAVGKRDWIIALPEVRIGEVHADRDVANADFAFARIADRLIFDPENLRTAGFVESNDFRQQSSPTEIQAWTITGQQSGLSRSRQSLILLVTLWERNGDCSRRGTDGLFRGGRQTAPRCHALAQKSRPVTIDGKQSKSNASGAFRCATTPGKLGYVRMPDVRAFDGRSAQAFRFGRD